jgi:hypothetical protein
VERQLEIVVCGRSGMCVVINIRGAGPFRG